MSKLTIPLLLLAAACSAPQDGSVELRGRIDGTMAQQAPTSDEADLLLSAQYRFYDDRPQMNADSTD